MLSSRPEQAAGLLRSLILYYGNPWRLRRMSHFYAQFVGPGALCFDIGAHVGNRAWVWSGLGAQVVAAEPQLTLARWLRWAFRGRPGVTVLQSALGATPGQATLHTAGINTTVASLSSDWIAEAGRQPQFSAVRWTPGYAVNLTTLDALIDRFGVPALCKLDVEGFEYETLCGLSRAIPVISFEFLPATFAVARQCVERLEQLGRYEFNWFLGESHRWERSRWLDARSMTGELANLARGTRSGDIFARQLPSG